MCHHSGKLRHAHPPQAHRRILDMVGGASAAYLLAFLRSGDDRGLYDRCAFSDEGQFDDPGYSVVDVDRNFRRRIRWRAAVRAVVWRDRHCVAGWPGRIRWRAAVRAVVSELRRLHREIHLRRRLSHSVEIKLYHYPACRIVASVIPRGTQCSAAHVACPLRAGNDQSSAGIDQSGLRRRCRALVSGRVKKPQCRGSS